jgi:AcrR family transcriptional regulator
MSSPAGKREAIVAAATELFRLYGFRKTSVDQIAQTAAVAKPTVYAYFEDKDAVFVAVCQAVMERIVAGARAARDEADVVERVAAVLGAKFTTIYELVESSPHARELLASRNDEANRVVAAADAEYEELLVGTLRAAARAGELDVAALGGAPALAKLLRRAGHGASYDATSVEMHRASLQALVRAVLRAGLVRG